MLSVHLRAFEQWQSTPECLHPLQSSGASKQRAQQACAECLGLVGAVDPAHTAISLAQPLTLTLDPPALLRALIEDHLARILLVAPSLQVLDAATISVQVASCIHLTVFTSEVDVELPCALRAPSPSPPGLLVNKIVSAIVFLI